MRQLAVGGWLLTVAATVAALVIRIVSQAPVLPNRFGLADSATTAVGLLQVTSATVAVLILLRLPRQPIGWLLLATGAFYAISLVGAAVAFAAVADPALGRGMGQWAGWVAFMASTISGITLVAIAFFFPDGRPASRWFAQLLRWLTIPSIVGALLITLQPGPMFLLITLDNPIGVGPDVVGFLGPMAVPLILGGSVALTPLAAVSVVARFRRSRGLERQQIKWLAAAATMTIASLVVTSWFGFSGTGPIAGEWPLVIFALASTSVPIAVGMAILRYHLYEIDRIVSRTIAYAVVTGVLGASYVGLVLLLQGQLGSLTGGNTLAVAGSTLIVAAAAQPLRRAVQAPIDRRFNRAHIDAQRMLAVFGVRVRNEMDVSRLGDAVVAAAADAVRPVTAALWLRGATR